MSNGEQHNVKDGESAESLAASCGLPLAKVWDLPENASLKALRDKDPHILSPGDKLFLPASAPKKYTFATDQTHNITVSLPKSNLKVQFKRRGEPLKAIPCVLKIDGKIVAPDKTDDQGMVEAVISATAKSASITIGEGEGAVTYNLVLRGLHPTAVATGWQARLQNLGYPMGTVGGQTDRRGQASLCAFRADQKVKRSGEMDPETQDKLKGIYGC